MAPFQVGNPAGLYWLLALLPLIILYLIRPRPKVMNIPSLMFFLRSSGSRRLTSFLRQITHDWLFLIQLLLLAGLALTFSEPFSAYEHDITASSTVIVLDVSASMQTMEGVHSRFDLAVSQAKKVLGAKTTIILAKDAPYIALQDASADDAIRFLNSLQPRDTPTRLGEAIILAGEALGEGRVVVISDFINTGGQDPDIAKAVLESKKLVVDFINVAGSKRRNVGIVQLDAGNDETTVYVKNYNDVQEQIALRVGGSQNVLKVSPKGIETFSFKTPSGVTKLELGVRDDLSVDNVVFLSAPKGGKARILLVANNASPFLRNGLLASGEVDVVVAVPPVIPREEFDVVVLNNLDMKQVLPGTFEDLYKFAELGGTVIVAVQGNSAKIDYKGVLPVKLGEKLDGGFVNVEQLNRFTKNIDFGKVNEFIAAEPTSEQTIIATVNAVPVITVKRLGAGKLVYFGIPDDADFKFSPHFPIFWTELLKFVTEQQDVRNLNFKTGETLLLDSEQKVRTPSKTVQRSALLLDEAGVYELEDRVIVANLVNELESEVNSAKQVGAKSTDYELRPVKETRRFIWDVWLIAIALFLLVFEVFFVKWRGDV
ncbi:VWA domain-containing protein [Candidatus Woesearchaeota archaeon]|nr:VWA domain-containing protein [Candidatus Woesearchaeota archaeon]